jgi:hypothetical protein
MSLESTKRESIKRDNQKYFAAWDKKIENTSMGILSDMAMPVVIFLVLNIFVIAVLVKLNLF